MISLNIQGTEIPEDTIDSLRWNAGTSWTRNEQFDDDGYLKVKNFYDIEPLKESPNKLKQIANGLGRVVYYGKTVDDYSVDEITLQVPGSLSRYSYPKTEYKEAHNSIRLKVEKIIGRKLYNTYYFDRFYFPGQDLFKHNDRSSCEISVSLNISINLKGKDQDWPFWIRTPLKFEDKKKRILKSNGENRFVFLNPGDAVIYKGCECIHWREPMPGIVGNEEQYYHQIFFHYVLADGRRVEFAGDSR